MHSPVMFTSHDERAQQMILDMGKSLRCSRLTLSNGAVLFGLHDGIVMTVEPYGPLIEAGESVGLHGVETMVHRMGVQLYSEKHEVVFREETTQSTTFPAIDKSLRRLVIHEKTGQFNLHGDPKVYDKIIKVYASRLAEVLGFWEYATAPTGNGYEAD